MGALLKPDSLSQRDKMKIARRFNAGRIVRFQQVPKGRLKSATAKINFRKNIRSFAPSALSTTSPPLRGGEGDRYMHFWPIRSFTLGTQPSLRDSVSLFFHPGVETPGYCQSSLRDEGRSRVLLELLKGRFR